MVVNNYNPKMVIFSLYGVYHFLVLAIKTNLANKTKDKTFSPIEEHIRVSELLSEYLDTYLKSLVTYVIENNGATDNFQELDVMHQILLDCCVTCRNIRHGIITETIKMASEELISIIPQFSCLDKTLIMHDMINGDEVILTYVED